MTHLIGPPGSRGGTRAWLAIAIGFALLVATTIESAHAHDESEEDSVCFVCSIGHQDAPTSAADTPVLDGPATLLGPALPGHRLVAGIVHPSPHRSRAPPLPISP